MKALIIVDTQFDFCDPNGALYVPKAEEAVKNIADLIENPEKLGINKIVLTVDWHPINHCSFKENGGNWPSHCIQHTKGASIDQTIMDSLIKSRGLYNTIVKEDEYIFNSTGCDNLLGSGRVNVFKKGTLSNLEEYGAFDSHGKSNRYIIFQNQEQTNSINVRFIEPQPIEEIIVCGVAGDYCVLETIKKLRVSELENKISVFLPGIASIDGGQKLEEYIKSTGIKTYAN